jgi:hypothetical protein
VDKAQRAHQHFQEKMVGHGASGPLPTLPTRPVERLQKVLLGRRRGLRRTLLQDEFALDAQQLGDAPSLLVALGSRQRLVDDRYPFGGFAVATRASAISARNRVLRRPSTS